MHLLDLLGVSREVDVVGKVLAKHMDHPVRLFVSVLDQHS